MLKPIPFANAIAVTTAALTVLLWALRFLLPPFFAFFFNAQFFGADVASLLPKEANLLLMLAEFIALLAGAWWIGWLWATLYNRWAK
jgi:hypothetical protein